MEKTPVTKATLGRLPEYLRFLKSLPSESFPYISATAIAKALKLGDVQVRKDLASVSGNGKPKLGYDIEDLIKRIEQFLGYGELTPAVLVGAGKLGCALLQYSGFEQYGIKIAAAFDCNEETIESSDKQRIMSMDNFEDYCRKHNNKIGIITVGKESAQDVCDKMVNGGIIAIWNFAPCKLRVPNGIVVENENLALSLAQLNNLLRK